MCLQLKDQTRIRGMQLRNHNNTMLWINRNNLKEVTAGPACFRLLNPRWCTFIGKWNFMGHVFVAILTLSKIISGLLLTAGSQLGQPGWIRYYITMSNQVHSNVSFFRCPNQCDIALWGWNGYWFNMDLSSPFKKVVAICGTNRSRNNNFFPMHIGSKINISEHYSKWSFFKWSFHDFYQLVNCA